jgi:hypothetical protein
VRFEESDPENRWNADIWGKDQQKVFFTRITCTLYSAGDHDGRVVGEMVSTYTSRGTNSIQGVLQALGYAEQLKGIPKTRAALVLMLNEALQGDGAPAEIEIEWEATEKLSDEERAQMKAEGKKPWRFTGMSRFDRDADGNPIALKEYKGQQCRAYNVIDRWITATGEAPEAPKAAPAPPPRAAAPTPRPAPVAAAAAPAGPPVPRRAGPPVPAGARK